MPFCRPPKLSTLFERLPIYPVNRVFVFGLQRVLAKKISEGELDFLQGRCCAIKVTDLNITLTLGLSGTQLMVGSNAADVTIAADMATFIQMASRQIDPDTLFFQRRLLITGDTELGLYIKNFLDRFEFEPQHQLLQNAIQHLGRRFDLHAASH